MGSLDANAGGATLGMARTAGRIGSEASESVELRSSSSSKGRGRGTGTGPPARATGSSPSSSSSSSSSSLRAFSWMGRRSAAGGRVVAGRGGWVVRTGFPLRGRMVGASCAGSSGSAGSAGSSSA